MCLDHRQRAFSVSSIEGEEIKEWWQIVIILEEDLTLQDLMVGFYCIFHWVCNCRYTFSSLQSKICNKYCANQSRIKKTTLCYILPFMRRSGEDNDYFLVETLESLVLDIAASVCGKYHECFLEMLLDNNKANLKV